MLPLIFWIGTGLIIYVYFGYPVLIFLLSNFGSPLRYSREFQPRVTLVFAANNEESVIREKIVNCLNLDYPQNKLQILVVDDGSTDKTTSIVKEYEEKGVELRSYPKRRGKLTSLNDAMEFATGDILFFSDADNFYPPNAINEAVKYFADPTVGGVSGGREVIGDSSLGRSEGLYWRYEEFIKTYETRLGSCVGVAGDLLVIRKSLYKRPPENIINDDFFRALAVLKKGKRVIYAPEARSSHPVAKTVQGEFERRARMIAGRYQSIFWGWKMLPYSNPILVWQIVSHKFLRPIVPFAMILVFVANLLQLFSHYNDLKCFIWCLSRPYDIIFFLMQILFYSIAVLGAIFKPANGAFKFMYIPTFLVTSNIAALVGLYRFLSTKQTVLWKKAARQ